jgi:putative transposase
MPSESIGKIELSSESEQALNKIAKSYTSGQQLVKRVRIIQLSGEGKSQQAIARDVGVNRHTVRHWQARWRVLEAIPLSELSVEERLEDLPRPGTPARITADQRCQIEALACEAPEKHGRPISQWSSREIADEVIQQKIVATISPRHAARLLKRSLDSPAQKSLLVEWPQRRSLYRQESSHQSVVSTSTRVSQTR